VLLTPVASVTQDLNIPAQEWPWNKVMEEVQTRRLSRALEEAWKEAEDKKGKVSDEGTRPRNS